MGFDQLMSLVPSLTNQRNSKVSKATVLQKSKLDMLIGKTDQFVIYFDNVNNIITQVTNQTLELLDLKTMYDIPHI